MGVINLFGIPAVKTDRNKIMRAEYLVYLVLTKMAYGMITSTYIFYRIIYYVYMLLPFIYIRSPDMLCSPVCLVVLARLFCCSMNTWRNTDSLEMKEGSIYLGKL